MSSAALGLWPPALAVKHRSRQNVDHLTESFSERSVGEHEQFDWMNYNKLSSTAYPDDFGASGRDFKLHFDDIYNPLEPSDLKLDPGI